jgi:hypothetical protein
MTIKKETVQHFRYPGNALDRQMQKFSLHPDAEVDSLTDEQRAVMPEIRRIHTRRTDLIKSMLAHWIDFLRKSGSIKLVE